MRDILASQGQRLARNVVLRPGIDADLVKKIKECCDCYVTS